MFIDLYVIFFFACYLGFNIIVIRQLSKENYELKREKERCDF